MLRLIGAIAGVLAGEPVLDLCITGWRRVEKVGTRETRHVGRPSYFAHEPSIDTLKFWQTITRPLSTLRFAKTTWFFKIACSVLIFYLVVGLIAIVGWFGFGRNAEQQVVEIAGSLTEIVGIVLAPVLLIGLIAVPLHRWIIRKLLNFISALDQDRPKT